MARLPTVGGDSGDWGNVLNAFLAVSLSADGNLKISSWADSSARPTSPENGQIGINLGTKIIEKYNGTTSTWKKIAGPGPAIVTVTPASSMTIDADSTDIADITVNVAATIENPSGTPIDGQMLFFRFTMDSSGHGLSWGTKFAFGSDITTAIIPSSASAKFEMAFRYNTTDLKWRAVALARGF